MMELLDRMTGRRGSKIIMFKTFPSFTSPERAPAAAGFEHCIANAYFTPFGLFIKAGAPAPFWSAVGKTASDFAALTWRHFWIGNLLPVMIGKLIGGTVMVAAVYWFVYLRQRLHQ